MPFDGPDEIEGTEPAHHNEFTAAADKQIAQTRAGAQCASPRVPDRVNVCNLSYGVHERADHTYTVTDERGQPTDCTCPAVEYQLGACKHVRGRRRSSGPRRGHARRLRFYPTYTDADANANQAVATDGGAREPTMTCEAETVGGATTTSTRAPRARSATRGANRTPNWRASDYE